MAEEDQTDDAQKTEDPTPKKIEEARKKGQVALSREVNNWVILLAATILVAVLSPSFFHHMLEILKAYIERADSISQMPGGMGIVLGEGLKKVLLVMFMPLALLMLAAFLSPFLQVGPLFAPGAIKPALSKISPIKGFTRLFSKRALMEFAKGILKISLIGVVGVIILYPYFGQLEHIIGAPMPVLLTEIRLLVIKMMIGVLVVLMVLAAIDLLYQRYEHMKKMRMSKQEIKDEYKQTEGDPHVRARLRQLRSEKARQRMMQAVPTADVVITNPTHFSIALKYDPETMEQLARALALAIAARG